MTGDLDQPPGQLVRPLRAFPLGQQGERSLERGLAHILRGFRIGVPASALTQDC